MKVLSLPLLGVLATSTVSAQLISLNLLDPNVEVGELFSVEVNVAKSTESLTSELLSFAFDIGALNNLTLQSAVVAAPFLDESGIVPYDVAGSAFPGLPDASLTLAVLSFIAPAEGFASFSINGPIDVFGGLKYTDFDPQNPLGPTFNDANYAIDGLLELTILPRSLVPEPSWVVPAGLALIMMALLGSRRRRA